jgi:hypothetical protein
MLADATRAAAAKGAEQRDLLRYYEVEQLRLTRAHHSLAQKLRVS